jgi:glycosyltransferase involved in cell wall biosynthesis
MTPQKILFVVTEDRYFCSHRLQLAAFAVSHGHEVVVATRVTDCREVIEEARIRTVPLRRLKRSSLNFVRELAALIELIYVFRRERPDLVHLVALKPVVYGYFAARLSGDFPIINALGGLGYIFSSRRIVARLLRFILLYALRHVLNSPRSTLILQNSDDLIYLSAKAQVSGEKMRLIRGAGVDLKLYSVEELPDGPPIVMLASRMLWDKGIGEFVEASSALKALGVDARFVLVGGPDPENPSSISRTQLQKWHASGVVEWWGYRSDMPKVLAQSSIVCLPSYYGEGVPKILIEAMACGRPIVTTDMPGCRDLVRSGRNGVLVRPRDPVALMEGLHSFMLNKSLLQLMGIEGRRIVEDEFSLSRVAHETMEVYEGALFP